MLVAKLYDIEYQSLVGKEYKPGYYFTFMKDCNDNWVIPKTEVDENTNPITFWVIYCPIIELC